MQTSTAFAPSPNADDFATFLAKLSEQPGIHAAHEMDDALGEEMELLSYEHALRAPVPKPTKPVPPATPSATLATGETTISLVTTEKRKIRTSICVTQSENALLHQRAAENGLSVSAYVRACVFEVEALRAQVKQMMAQVHTASASAEFSPPKPAIDAAAEQPVLDAPKKQSALPVPGAAAEPIQRRPRVPLTAREPQPRPTTMTEASLRLRAAIEAQKQISQRDRPVPVKKPRSFFGILFGMRRSA
jgi:hypothetical protein